VRRKGRYSEAAACEFKEQLGVGPGKWLCQWNPEAPVLLEPIVPGRYGSIYPFGRGRLGVHIVGGRKVAQGIRDFGWKPLCGEYDPDDNSEHSEEAFVVETEQLDDAARLTRAYVRRRLSQAQRRAGAERLRKWRAGSLTETEPGPTSRAVQTVRTGDRLTAHAGSAPREERPIALPEPVATGSGRER
jgi:hypothetical protein